MSGRYETQLQILKDTYEWALNASIDKLKKSVELSLESPLIAIGSGGSLTVASLASLLHVNFTGCAACWMTPFEFVSRKNAVHDASFLWLLQEEEILIFFLLLER